MARLLTVVTTDDGCRVSTSTVGRAIAKAAVHSIPSRSDAGATACAAVALLRARMFNRIRESKPDVVNKVIAIPGDITLPNLGLSDENKRILEKINVVFHCAATLRLESNLKDAVLMNTFPPP
ncbi:hypothetical protein TSAR_010943 [Trichomalopsis sarcophagae]|uniref:Fatty acyl-CoA reductase n=1 Tax=Trichomalopsis sarcophagae TaxID=543379 RepID=A0A232FDX3_9HYME|nr:hypothetical protein TSAR_010943 [Trichomalopsis sarcophagae]